MLRIQKILFPTDFSEPSRVALDHALLWTELHDAELTLLHVLSLRTADPFNPEHHFPPPEEFEQRLHALADSEMALFLQPHENRPLRIRQLVRQAPEIERGVLEFAESEDIDLIVLGTHGRRGAAHLLMGSTASEILRRSERAVLVVPARGDRPAGRLRRILAPTDFSAASRHAITHARELGASSSALVELFHVLPNLEVPMPMNPGSFGGGVVADLEPTAQEALRALTREPGPEAQMVTEVWHGAPATSILNRAIETDADLIVMASQGHSGLDRLLLGSVTERVARLSKCPVLVVPREGWSLLPAS